MRFVHLTGQNDRKFNQKILNEVVSKLHKEKRRSWPNAKINYSKSKQNRLRKKILMERMQ